MRRRAAARASWPWRWARWKRTPRSTGISTVLRLYLVGGTPPSERALAAVPALRAALGGQAELDVVDLREQPERAEAERILATPLLVRVSPPPVRRIVGDLSDADRVVWTLGLGDGGA